jgi:hypothetical protein
MMLREKPLGWRTRKRDVYSTESVRSSDDLEEREGSAEEPQKDREQVAAHFLCAVPGGIVIRCGETHTRLSSVSFRTDFPDVQVLVFIEVWNCSISEELSDNFTSLLS